MIPIPGFERVEYNWVTIKGEGFTLYGFLLYTTTDREFSDYMNNDGFVDLEQWTGEGLEVFIVQSPSEEWIEYARSTNHAWWKLFGEQAEFLEKHQDAAVLPTKEGPKTLREVFAPWFNKFLQAEEISKILDQFGIERTKHPCMVLFKDLEDKFFNFSDFRDLLNVPQQMVRISLRKWLEGPEFIEVMKEAQHA